MGEKKIVIIDPSVLPFRGWLQHLKGQLTQWHQAAPYTTVKLYYVDGFQDVGRRSAGLFENASFASVISENMTDLDNGLPFGQQRLKPQTLLEGITNEVATYDVWELIQKLYKQTVQQEIDSMLLYTADITTIDRIVCNSMTKIMIYNARNGSIIGQSRWGKKNTVINNDKELVYPYKSFDVSPGTTVYDGTGIVIGTLDSILNWGGEGSIFSLKETQDSVVKVYFADSFEKRKLTNIKSVCGKHRDMGIDWAIFPDHVAYLDRGQEYPVGFVMAKRTCSMNLADDELYVGRCSKLTKKDLQRTVGDSIDLCIQVLDQAYLLAQNGFLVSDYSKANFSYRDDSSSIQMWDVDSFGHGTYFSCMRDRVHLTRQYAPTSKTDLIDKCQELAYDLAFNILTLGDYPLDRLKRFVYDIPNYDAIGRKELIPKNVWALFENVFRKKRKASIPVLLAELERAKKEDPLCKVTYKKLLGKIGYIDSYKIARRILLVLLLLAILLGVALAVVNRL